jgi:DNA mismatch repair protein MutL
MPIRVLPDEVATRIAAGEVVERPASVIKELIENAIDAGASDIRLDIVGGGHKRMRVVDNGSGIPAAEVELAFARHSTSKLTSVDDLEHIHTLGFRGEALASIASVARVTLETRAAGEAVGTQVRLEGGMLTAREPSGRPPGTAITVADLFYNVPARRKFLRTERTERRHIDVLVTRYAMAYPDLRFSLSHEGRNTFHSDGSGDLREVLLSVYGSTNSAHMIKVGQLPTSGDGSIAVSGYVSAPSLHRSNRNEITLFINGRWVQDQRLAFAVIQAYHTLLMTKRYPIAVLKVELPAEDVDVNVHPSKTQVRFRDGDAVFRSVQRAVRRALVDQAPVPEIQSTPTDSKAQSVVEGGEWPGGWPSPEQLVRRAQLRSLGRQLAPSGALGSREAQTELGMPRASAPTTRRGEDEPELSDPVGQPVVDSDERLSRSPDAPKGANRLPFLRVVGQLGLTYVIAEGPEGMYLIDQHAAHERVLFERFMMQKAKTVVPSQALLEPLTVDVTPEGASLVQEHLDELLELGFDVAPFGGATVLVRAVPALLVGTNVQSSFDEIVADLQVGDEPMAGDIEARVVRQVCKQAAIKAGQSLSHKEMDELVRQLEQCVSPRTCPHGRPTMIHMSAMQLAQEFGRLG